MNRVNVSDAKAHFSSIVESVQRGATVLICKRNLPVAKLEPIPSVGPGKKHETMIGWAEGSGVRILGDVTEPAIAETDWAMLR